MKRFWVDSQRDVSISYGELISELNSRETRRPIVQTNDPAELFIELLVSILGEEEIVLLDAEFSDETLSALGYDDESVSRTEPAPDIAVNDPDDLALQLQETSEEWTLGLYTSGTTGTPSRIDQTLKTLTRNVRRDERFQDNVWAFAYNPSHFAGLQVFFQAVLNQNPMVYVFEHSVDEIDAAIREFGITHISATPTFYRLRLQRLDGEYPTVERLTSGGEKFEPSLKNTLRDRFPNAKFRNVYALTEAGSLLESDGERFSIPEEYQEQLKITDGNELAIHESLLSSSASERLDEWLYTGDLVEFVDGDQFQFVGRETDFVNVGGYRVNPHDVEELINSVEGVQAAIVTARESSVTGNILVAEVKPAEEADHAAVKQAINDAVSRLERWKQPRVIDIVDELQQSRSGKRIR